MTIRAEQLEAGLATFGHSCFRPGQREAIETLLDSRRLLLVAPTGGGKSLAYQLPASLLPGTTLVISPLIALMHDQVEALAARGVPATYLASTLDAVELRDRLERIGRGEFKLAYVAPERLASSEFQFLLDRIDCPLVAIDEAHCISEWGHDFRPDYMQIAGVLARLPKARVMACTATATPVVRDEILQRLELGADTPQIVRGFRRPNLRLRCTDVGNMQERRAAVDAQLAEALKGGGAAIVYSPTRRMSEQEASRLAGLGHHAACYHAGLTPEQREEAQRGFMEGSLDVIVATNAFGMGIDRADVRSVIHLGPPGSVEAYYQEVGRAGRDGEPAFGLLIVSAQDLPRRRALLEKPSDDGEADAELVEYKWGLFLELMRWAEGGSCRQEGILRYFGEIDDAQSGQCGICDVCEGLAQGDQDPEQVALTARKALSGVARVDGRFGLTAAVKLLKGADDPRLERSGLDQVKTFGALSEHPEPWITNLLRRCVTAGWVAFSGADRPTVRLTAEGRDVMLDRRPARILLPATRTTRAKSSPKPLLLGDDLDSDALALFEALRAHRLEVAKTRKVPPYVVASDRTLRELALIKPTNADELLLVHGIGPAKAREYGEGFLATLARGAVS